ncbi:hypothetical protein EVAR_67365_1 [Eumeta japonica]|uniref:Uncharacterized protein n=1 Tax=Eumeta variegata TaxID=151549 RepID=A0A4C1ZSC4_EUMVA|nr:hypothetical protein EVAR_67365_1 [Eumeta japonica]
MLKRASHFQLDCGRAMLGSSGLQHENGSTRCVKYHTLIEYRREATAYSLRFIQCARDSISFSINCSVVTSRPAAFDRAARPPPGTFITEASILCDRLTPT